MFSRVELLERLGEDVREEVDTWWESTREINERLLQNKRGYKVRGEYFVQDVLNDYDKVLEFINTGKEMYEALGKDRDVLYSDAIGVYTEMLGDGVGYFSRDVKLGIQKMLAEYLNEDLKEWLVTNEVNKKYTVHCRDYGRVGSLYAVYEGDLELVQFSLSDKYYGMHKRPLGRKKVEENARDYIEELNKILEESLGKLEMYYKVLENPGKYTKNFLERLQLVILNGEDTKKKIKDVIKNEEATVFRNLKQVEMYKKSTGTTVLNDKKLEDASNILGEFFEDRGFKLEKRRDYLY